VLSGGSWPWRSLALVLVLGTPSSVTCKQLVIAAVGDFLTVGEDPKNPSGYSDILAMRLSGAAKVINFGETRATMRGGGIVSYSNSVPYEDLLKSSPDIVTLMLGTNDARTSFWDENEFKKGAKSLILDCLSLSSHPHVVVFQPPPLYRDGVDSMQQHVVNDLELRAIPEAVATSGSPGLPGSIQYSRAMWDAMGGMDLRCKECYFAAGHTNDGSHPTSFGFKKMADAAFDTLMAQDILPSTLLGRMEPASGKPATELSTANQIRQNAEVNGGDANFMQPLPPKEPSNLYARPTTTTIPVNIPDGDDFGVETSPEKQVPIPQGLPSDVVQKIVDARTSHTSGKDAFSPSTVLSGDQVHKGVQPSMQSRQSETPEDQDLQALVPQGLPQGLPKGLPKSVVATITKATAEQGLGQPQTKEQADGGLRQQTDRPPEVSPSKSKEKWLKPEASQSAANETTFASTLTHIMPPIGAALLPCSAAAFILHQAASKRGFAPVPRDRY